MKANSLLVKCILFVVGTCAGGLLTGCQSTFNNPNDWAFRKGASPEHVPLQVSKKVYR